MLAGRDPGGPQSPTKPRESTALPERVSVAVDGEASVGAEMKEKGGCYWAVEIAQKTPLFLVLFCCSCGAFCLMICACFKVREFCLNKETR